MICHALYRNREFDECLHYLDEFYEDINAFDKSHFNTFYPKFVLLKSAVQCYKGELEKAIALLEQTINNPALKLNFVDEFDMRLNLSVYYGYLGALKTANKNTLWFHHSDKWYEKKMGKDWVLRKNLIDILIQYELGNDEIALNRIRSLDRIFADDFKKVAFQKSKIFLDFIRYYISDPLVMDNEKFRVKAEKAMGKVPPHQFGIQTVAFYSWFQSKMEKRNYYEMVMEGVNG